MRDEINENKVIDPSSSITISSREQLCICKIWITFFEVFIAEGVLT